MLLLILVQIIVFPVKISFSLYIDELYWNLIPLMMHLFDMLLTFNTAFYLDGNIVEDRRKIASNYFQF